MPPTKVIAVVGATGAQGGGLVRAILNDRSGQFAARAITRDVNSPKAQELMFSQQQIPSVAGAKAPSTEPYLGQVASAWQAVEGDDGLMFYTDWASPTMYQTLASNFQKLMADKTSAQDMATAVQDDWTKFDDSLK